MKASALCVIALHGPQLTLGVADMERTKCNMRHRHRNGYALLRTLSSVWVIFS